MILDDAYWQARWEAENTPWDIGHASPAIVDFVKANIAKDAKILIPGCGNAYEAEALLNLGYENVHIIDLSKTALALFIDRVPHFPMAHIHCGDFFEMKDSFDVIIEQTFFCALEPTLRNAYAQKVYELLKSEGILTGLLFNIPLNADKPPFGGDIEAYKLIFDTLFTLVEIETCATSIKPRLGNELYIHFQKK